MHNRTGIRKYVKNLLRLKVTEVSNRVWFDRPSSRYLDMLPCVLVSTGPEQVEIISGSENTPKVYLRRLRLQVDILTRNLLSESDEFDPDSNETAEDTADMIAGQTEKCLADDCTLGRLLPTWNPETGEGLARGLSIISTDPYNIDSDTEVRVLVQRITIEIPYETNAFIDKKFTSFREYFMSINKVGYDSTTIDPILLSAEGQTQ